MATSYETLYENTKRDISTKTVEISPILYILSLFLFLGVLEMNITLVLL